MKEKLLILVRHAHRDTSERELDNGLSERGRKQAREVLKAFETHWESDFKNGKIALISSPKKRCIETLDPLSKHLETAVQISPLLDEQHSSENSASMLKRIEQFISWWKNDAPPLTLACSHGDWLPVCTEELVGSPVGFEKGAWVVISLEVDPASGPKARPQLKALRP
ncbi:MAG: histidine phosphatase family protein [Methylotenera sp.]|nr:histidine phosphatase family protein [Oligoflexia bacterium]